VIGRQEFPDFSIHDTHFIFGGNMVRSASGRSVAVYRSIEDIRVLTEKEQLTGEGILPGCQCRVEEWFLGLRQ